MGALQIQSNSIGQILQVNARFGRLMLDERLLAGRSVRTVAKRMKVKREQLRKWEAGRASPPARKFIAIMRVYGREAVYRAAELDLQIQIEKYALVKEMIEKDLNSYSCKSKFTHPLAA